MENYATPPAQREIIVYKLHPQPSNPSFGLLRVVAERTDSGYEEVTEDNLCPTGKIFVTKDYDELDQKYGDLQLFKVFASRSKFKDEGSEKDCKYVTTAFGTEPLKPKELIEIVQHKLPDPNNPIADLNQIPSTPYIYLDDEGVCYGPFKWSLLDESSVTLSKIDSPLPGRKLVAGTIFSGETYKLNEHTLYANFAGISGRRYFKNLAELHNNPDLVAIDYSSDEDVVNNFLKIAKEVGFNSKKVDLAFLEASVKKSPRHHHKAIITKLDKLKDIASEHQAFREGIMSGFDKLLQSELGEAYTKSYIENNEETLLAGLRERCMADLNEEIIGSRNELNSIRDKIEERKGELVELGKQIEKTKSVKLKAGEINNIAERESLDEVVNQKREQLAELNAQVKPLLEKYKALTTLQDIQKRIEEAEIEYNNELKRHVKIEDQTKALESQLRWTDQELSAKLMGLKPFVESINGNVGISQKRALRDVTTAVNPIECSSDTARQILDYLEYGFNKEGRGFSRLDIINLMVTMQQSFIFFLAGLPGGGKTTLARMLAKLHGIYDKRFLDVSVARGWSGQKDLIGFYNPISGKYQSSSTGMYEFLQALGKEADEKTPDTDVAPSLILLDEANLSPMEHYWSSFMGLTDSVEDKKLVLGEDSVTIPDNLRFIATINYDSTTEYLSPRLIDRSPIVVLEPNNLNSATLDLGEEPELTMPVSHATLDECFGRIETLPELTDNEQTIYSAVKQVLENRDSSLGKPIIISSRKEIAIRQYCNKARPLMREASSDDDSLALDYAILQLVLPLVRGHGRGFAQRLEQLKEVLLEGELEKSANYLTSMMSNGDTDLNTYDFFCW